MKKLILTSVFIMLFAGPTFGQILNGSFETGPDFGSGNFVRVNPGGTDIASWTVVSGNVDYLGPHVAVCDGIRTVDMNGSGPGAMSQTFGTTPGTEYRVTFCMAGNPNGAPAVKTLDVSVTGGSTRSYQFDTTGLTLSNMGWTQNTYAFEATGPSATITFTSTTLNSAYGPVLDNVVLSPLTTWTGAFSYSLKTTLQQTDNSENQTFRTANQAFAGTISLYTGDDELTTNAEGCYLKFSGNDGTTICIKEIAVISTQSEKSKTEKGLLVGSGEFAATTEEGAIKGVAYVDAKVTLKQDVSNNLLSIGLSGKLAGGVDSNFVFNGTMNNTTLTR